MPTLIVQKGHCYRTTGATGTTGEQAFATKVADAAVRLLNGRNGWKVRAILADVPSSYYSGDAFAAIHCDGSTNRSARGASVGYQNNEGRAFGLAWKRAYHARGWTGGFRADNYTSALAGYYGVRTARGVGNRRAIIIESGFLTNDSDRALLLGAGGPERVALAIGDALGITTTQEDDDVTKDELKAAIREVLREPFVNPREDNIDRRTTTLETMIKFSDWRYVRLVNALKAMIVPLYDDEAKAQAAFAKIDATLAEMREQLPDHGPTQ